MTTLILAVLGVLLASGFCSGAEAALLSVPLSKSRQLAEHGGGNAKALLALQENLNRPISTIVILNNIANIVGSIAVGALATEALGDAWLGVFSAVLTAAIIVFSEIIPKTLGSRYAVGLSLVLARPITLLATVMRPLVWLMELVTSLVSAPPGATTNEAEIAFLVRAGSKEGALEDDEEQMILNIFQLNDLSVGELMTPRIVMTWLRADLSIEAQRDTILGSQHTRLVVVGETLDDVRGMSLQRDLLVALLEGHGDKPASAFLRPVDFVAIDMKADDLIPHFQARQQHLAVVLGPHGGVQGVITMEDLLEVITGEIVDETDRAADLQALARAKARPYMDGMLGGSGVQGEDPGDPEA